MRQKKLFRLLAALTPEEFKRCRKAVQSPLFNTNPTVVQLFELIKRQYPNFRSKPKDIEKLYTKLFPNGKYNDNKMRRLLSFLTKVVEDFMVYLEMEAVAFHREKILLKAYRKRDLHDLFVRGTDDLLEKLETRPWRNARYYFEKLQLGQDRYSHPLHNKYDIKDNTLEDLMDDVDAYFAFTKMQMGIALKNKARILNKPYDLRLLEAVDEQMDGLMEENDLYKLYRYSLHLLEERETVNFEEYQELLFEYIDKLDKEGQRLLFYNGLNYCIRQVNRGGTQFSEIVLDWYKKGLKRNILLKDGYISGGSFGNIVFYGCRENEFEWVIRFIKDYSDFLKEDNKKDELACSLALVHFYKKEFEQVIFETAKCSFKPRYFLRSRNILIRTYFEMFLINQDNFHFLETSLNSFETYLYRNNIHNKESVSPHLNLTQILSGVSKRLLKKFDKKSASRWVQLQLDQKPNVISKKWLKELLK